jgi:hypothetical protein
MLHICSSFSFVLNLKYLNKILKTATQFLFTFKRDFILYS